jgi:hypothetical protein
LNSTSLRGDIGGESPNVTLPFVHDVNQRRALKRDDLELGNSLDDDVFVLPVGQSSKSSLSLRSAFTRIDDAHATARIRFQMNALGSSGEFSRKRRKLRESSTALFLPSLGTKVVASSADVHCIDLTSQDFPCKPQVSGDAARVIGNRAPVNSIGCSANKCSGKPDFCDGIDAPT